jgi:molybdate transport system substrate-binding protein
MVTLSRTCVTTLPNHRHQGQKIINTNLKKEFDMIFRIRLTIATLLFFFLATSAQAADLVVSAAASLTNAFGEMKAPFEKAHPGTNVVFNFAASGPLLKQIEQGAPVDVFASADQETMDKAASFIVPSSRVNFVGNVLVLIVPAQDGLALNSPADLRKDNVSRIAIGNPESVPVGRYTKAALTAAGLYEALEPKLVLAESVTQALDYVARGEVQAGFVYATDAASRQGKVKTAAEVTGHKPIIYPVALLEASGNKELGQAFINYVNGAEGQAILAKYGFKKP